MATFTAGLQGTRNFSYPTILQRGRSGGWECRHPHVWGSSLLVGVFPAPGALLQGCILYVGHLIHRKHSNRQGVNSNTLQKVTSALSRNRKGYCHTHGLEVSIKCLFLYQDCLMQTALKDCLMQSKYQISLGCTKMTPLRKEGGCGSSM